MHANKGVYAVLLGSGISRAAGIPTGWEVTLDLISRIALLDGEEARCAANPEEWYRKRFGEEPNYSRLLEKLVASPAERQQLLRGFFEPTEEDREEARKVPTAAHNAIADLVVRGYVRLIITTNFDRLMEQALEARGVTPTVIASPDAANGALPLVHSPCTIVKLHGDYRDVRILNTVEELAGYDPAIDKLLDQILDEYGLVVSGWSAEWDTALRAAIERTPSRRFSTYWTYPRKLTGAARDLIAHRHATAISNAPADGFFQKLAEDVISLEERDAHDSLTPDLAARTAKRYLPDPMQRIRLNDLVMAEVDRVRTELTTSPKFSLHGSVTGEDINQRMHLLEEESAVLMAMFAVAGFWSDATNRESWLRGISRLASASPTSDGYRLPLETLLGYPALLTMYATGIASIASGNIDMLLNLLRAQVPMSRNQTSPQRLVQATNTLEVLDIRYQKQLPGKERDYTPFSDRLSHLPALRTATKTMLSNDAEFTRTFDQFEYYAGLIAWDLNQWAPAGSFIWRDGRRGNSEHIIVCQDLERELKTLEQSHPLLAGDAFAGSVVRLREVKALYDNNLREWIR